MKKTCIWFLIGLLSLASAAWSPAQTAGGTEKAVALEQQWLQGQKANNPELIAPLLADKIVVTEADGKVLDKAGMLAFYKKTKWDSAEYTDVKVTAFGDTAIATGGFKGRAAMQRENLLITIGAGPTPGRRCPAVNGSVSPVMHRWQKRK
jgi:hypothetical protein